MVGGWVSTIKVIKMAPKPDQTFNGVHGEDFFLGLKRDYGEWSQRTVDEVIKSP